MYSFFLAGNFHFNFLRSLPSAHFVYRLPCYSRLSIVNWFAISSIWFCMYSVCSFGYMLANSFCAFSSICIGSVFPIAFGGRVRFSRLHAFPISANNCNWSLSLADVTAQEATGSRMLYAGDNQRLESTVYWFLLNDVWSDRE